MSATYHLQGDRLSNIIGIQEKCLKLYIIKIFHRGEVNSIKWWIPDEVLENNYWN